MGDGENAIPIYLDSMSPALEVLRKTETSTNSFPLHLDAGPLTRTHWRIGVGGDCFVLDRVYTQ